MKTIVITGGKRAGKSHILLSVARVLSNAGFQVLAVDTTKDADILSFFNINRTIEGGFSMNSFPVITREGFDIMAPGLRFDFKLLEGEMEDRDFILFEVDRVLSFPPDMPSQILMVQDMDIENLHTLEKLTTQFIKSYPNVPTTIVINNYIRCKLSLNFTYHLLDALPDQLFIIPMDLSNTTNALNSRVDGRLRLNGFTQEHNQAVFSLACKISGIENNRKNFKKLIR